MSTWRISGSNQSIYFIPEIPKIPVNSKLKNTQLATWIDLIEERTAGSTVNDYEDNLAALRKGSSQSYLALTLSGPSLGSSPYDLS